MKIGEEAENIVIGTAAIEAGPDLIGNVFKDMGGTQESIKNSPFGKSVENAVDFTQDVAPSVATLAFVWLGLKTMFKGFEDNGSSKKRPNRTVL